jgi:hypothetical protein
MVSKGASLLGLFVDDGIGAKGSKWRFIEVKVSKELGVS